MKPDDRVLLHRILYIAFLDIREAACEKKFSQGFYKLPHFLHDLPLSLLRVEEIDGGYQKIMSDLRERARILDCESWLDNAIQNITNWENAKIARKLD